MGTTDERPFIESARQEAQRRGWQFEHRRGDWSLLQPAVQRAVGR